MSITGATCPACASDDVVVFFEQVGVPVNSVLLLDDQQEAASFPTGDLAVGFCDSCAFVFNTAYDTGRSEYSARYEETQGYSKKFVDFATALAAEWVERHGLRGKTVLEIGCGSMGEFLQFMVDAGAGHGIGIDPALKVDRISGVDPDRFTWIADFYGPAYRHLDADAIVCRHTLEHIPQVGDFMRRVREAIGDRPTVPVLFELPDVERILTQVAFEDVYYEHCNYFSLGSLARLFRDTGFEVRRLERHYDDQYITVEAYPAPAPGTGEPLAEEDDLGRLRANLHTFSEGFDALVDRWTAKLGEVGAAGGTVVLWGGGSKAVSFLSSVPADLVSAAVDINPQKRGRFLPGTGLPVLGPEDLPELKPALVIAMNSIYLTEIQDELDRWSIDAELLGL